jgi:hypothetical protein
MNFLKAMARKRALKRYARELGPQLRQRYGASRHFTAAQIRATVKAAALDVIYIDLAFAIFLATEDEFNQVASGTITYADARNLFFSLTGRDQANFDPANPDDWEHLPEDNHA